MSKQVMSKQAMSETPIQNQHNRKKKKQEHEPCGINESISQELLSAECWVLE